MIKIDIDMLVAIYLMISIVILFLWILFEWRNGFLSGPGVNGSLWECPTCFYVYVDSCSEGISKCPRCQTLHRKREKV